ncbi:MAG: DUF4105 domain-containing protein, partial [Bacteroidota bacterium]
LQFYDPENNIDEVYNFGTFDMNTPNFYLKFLTGRLDYTLSRSNYNYFVSEYISDQRWVCSQEVKLNVLQLQKVYDSLQVVYRPENRYYRYDFFKNNCATKVFNLLLVFGGTPRMIDSLNIPAGITWREGLKTYIAGREWINAGINMLLGPLADRQISRLQSTFLPDFLMLEAENTGLAGFPAIVTNGRYSAPEATPPDIPMIIFWMLLIVLVIEALWLNTSKKFSDAIDMALFGISGLLGLLFLFFWFWSEHTSLHLNLNLFWAFPPNILMIWTIRTGRHKFTRIYLLLYALLQFFLLINWHRLPQDFPLELMPVTTLLVFRAVNRVFRFREKEAAIEISAGENR